MRCPFLREAQVKSCRASSFKKMIVRLPGQPENERCSSPDYINCPVAKQRAEEMPSIDHCPFLLESLVQYCTATPVTKYIPYTESINSQCGTASHKYCDLFLSLVHPNINFGENFRSEGGFAHDKTAGTFANDIRIPATLWFSPNHMWLDINTDGIFHIGVDAFLAKVLESIERITFITTKGMQQPTVVFTASGTDFQMKFPNPINIVRPNFYLRTNPAKLTADPYGAGWLFEGASEKQTHQPQVEKGLKTGPSAQKWMKNEIQRMTTRAHTLSMRPDFHGTILMTDGGNFQPGLARQLKRDDLLNLFNEFFSSSATWETTI
ncbi:MAG: hypothetical protein PHP42_03435 [Bacteroidota bacterium]|nr:hypothetical protein [Bacteroidota bacterium]